MIKYFSFLTLILFFTSCEENPFGAEDVIPHRSITGYANIEGVEPYPDGNHSGVFVWSHDLGIKTNSTADGFFEFVLPAASNPSSGGIVDGDYTIYFFLGNYSLKTITVSFAGGQIVSDDNVVNLKGELEKRVRLNQIINVKTTISPTAIPREIFGELGSDGDIKVTIDITPVRTDLYFYGKMYQNSRGANSYSGLLIRNKTTLELAYAFNPDTLSTMRSLIARPSMQLEMDFSIKNDSTGFVLPKGSYEILPFIILEREDLPKHLIEAIGSGYNTFSENYFKYPFHRTGGDFIVE